MKVKNASQFKCAHARETAGFQAHHENTNKLNLLNIILTLQLTFQATGQSVPQQLGPQQPIMDTSYLPTMYYATSALNSPPAMSAFPFINNNYDNLGALGGSWSNGAFDGQYNQLPTSQPLHDFRDFSNEHGYPASPTLTSQSSLYQPNLPVYFSPNSTNDYCWTTAGLPPMQGFNSFNSFQPLPYPNQEKGAVLQQTPDIDQVTESFSNLKPTDNPEPAPAPVPQDTGPKSWAAIASQPAKPKPKPEPVPANFGMKPGGPGGPVNVRGGGVRWSRARGNFPQGGPEYQNVIDTRPPPPPAVLERLKSENQYNPRELSLDLKNARYFVIKSYSEDDIHRSIKYNIWTSTEHGNKRLNEAWNDTKNKGPIYLVYSVNGSGHFCGVAEMVSGVDTNVCTGVWSQDKWKGKFDVKWIYVKDVPNNQLRHIKLENNDNKPVTNSRDTQEVPRDKGLQLMRIIHDYKHSTSIFDDFGHYEKRQDEDNARKVGFSQYVFC